MPVEEDAGVAHDVVQVLRRRAAGSVVLVEGPRAADPPQGDAAGPGGPAQVGVLAAVAGVVLVEAAGAVPGRGGAGERQRPEQVRVGTGQHPVLGRDGAGRVRDGQLPQAVDGVAAGGGRRQVADRPAQQAVVPGSTT
ncbi:MAG: hypothetical protein H7233_14340 [Pseudorhodobacter sp.]|nr:hypothetical protein [Frankiaceae bacterium]